MLKDGGLGRRSAELQNKDLVFANVAVALIRTALLDFWSPCRKGVASCNDRRSFFAFQSRFEREFATNPRGDIAIKVENPVLAVGPFRAAFFGAFDFERRQSGARITEGHHA